MNGVLPGYVPGFGTPYRIPPPRSSPGFHFAWGHLTVYTCGYSVRTSIGEDGMKGDAHRATCSDGRGHCDGVRSTVRQRRGTIRTGRFARFTRAKRPICGMPIQWIMTRSTVVHGALRQTYSPGNYHRTAGRQNGALAVHPQGPGCSCATGRSATDARSGTLPHYLRWDALRRRGDSNVRLTLMLHRLRPGPHRQFPAEQWLIHPYLPGSRSILLLSWDGATIARRRRERHPRFWPSGWAWVVNFPGGTGF